MSFRIYQLSKLGEAVSKSTDGDPNNPRWRILYYLKLNGAKDKDQIVSGTNLTNEEVSAALSELKSKHVVEEEGGVNIEE